MKTEVYLNLRDGIRGGEVAEIVAREMQVPSGYEVYPNLDERCWDVYVGGKEHDSRDGGVRVLSVSLREPGNRKVKVFSSILDLSNQKEHLEHAIHSADPQE